MEIFTKKYWITSFKELRDLKKIAFSGILIALFIIFDAFAKIINFQFLERRVSFSFVILMIAGWTSGPLLTILIAVCSDFLSFIIVPSGFPFFPGYTLSLALAGFIYSLFLYRKNLSILNVFVSRLFVSVFINAFLGSCWLMILTKIPYKLKLYHGLVKNITLFPFELTVVYLILSALNKPFLSLNVVYLPPIVNIIGARVDK